MIVAQITDFHVTTPGAEADRRYRTAEHLEAAVTHLNRLPVRPDVVVATGDLVHGGSVREYERLRGLLEPLAMPVYLIPGNHDDRANLRAVFSDHPYLPRDGTFLQYVVEDYPMRLMALDTVVPGEIGGALCAARLAWIEARLAEAPPRPTFVFMHHPPFRTGVGWTDSDGAAGLGGAARRHILAVRRRGLPDAPDGARHRGSRRKSAAPCARPGWPGSRPASPRRHRARRSSSCTTRRSVPGSDGPTATGRPRGSAGPRRSERRSPATPTSSASCAATVHRPIQAQWRGTVASTAPATAHQLTLALGPKSTIGAVMEPPACQLHLWARGEGGRCADRPPRTAHRTTSSPVHQPRR